MIRKFYKLFDYISSHLIGFLLTVIDFFIFLEWLKLYTQNTMQSIVLIIFGATFNIVIIFMYNSIISKSTSTSQYDRIKDIFGDIPAVDIKDIVKLTSGLNEVADMLLNSGEKGVIDVSIDKLSILWREGGVVKQEIVDSSDVLLSAEYQSRNMFVSETNQKIFDNDRVNDFYNKLRDIIQSIVDKDQSFAGEIKNDWAVANFLLYLLDYYGNCPSVVNVKGKRVADSEPDSIRLKTKVDISSLNQYDLLSYITLAEHSINVAENAIEITNQRTGSHHTILSNVIAALAHDIGKIPNYYENGSYTTYQHPVISANILKNQFYFNKIPASRRNFILNAVEMHHSYGKVSNNIVLETLKQADKQARADEIALVLEGLQDNKKDSETKETHQKTQIDQQITSFAEKAVTDDNMSDDINNEPTIEPAIEQNAETSKLENANNDNSANVDIKTNDKDSNLDVPAQNKIQNNKVKTIISQLSNSKKQSADEIIKERVRNSNGIPPTFQNEQDNIQTPAPIVPQESYVSNNNINCDVDFEQFIDQKFLDKMMEILEDDINIVRISSKTRKPYWSAFTKGHEVYVTGYGIRKYAMDVLRQDPAAELLYKDLVEEDRSYNIKKLKADEQGKKLDESVERPLNLQLLMHVVSLAKEAGLIEESKVQGQYFGGWFVVRMEDPDNPGEYIDISAFYTVFKGDVFKTDFDKLEQRKLDKGNGHLQKIKGISIDTNAKKKNIF